MMNVKALHQHMKSEGKERKEGKRDIPFVFRQPMPAPPSTPPSHPSGQKSGGATPPDSPHLTPLAPRTVRGGMRWLRGESGIMDALCQGAAEKSSPSTREGALIALEVLFEEMALQMEPLFDTLIPLLLNAIADTNAIVRQSASDATNALMRTLSPFGVRYITPALLACLQAQGTSKEEKGGKKEKGGKEKERSVVTGGYSFILAGSGSVPWRTKQGAVEMLGRMSHLSREQLGVAMHDIIPTLISVLRDPHPAIQESAKGALEMMGSVAECREIVEKVELIISALVDVSHTDEVLQIIAGWEEVEMVSVGGDESGLGSGTSSSSMVDVTKTIPDIHLDGASLALLFPILKRGLTSRQPFTRLLALRCTGNLAMMAPEADLRMYIPSLTTHLREALLDTTQFREASARCFALLVQGLGESGMGGVVEWMLRVMWGGRKMIGRKKNSRLSRRGTKQDCLHWKICERLFRRDHR